MTSGTCDNAECTGHLVRDDIKPAQNRSSEPVEGRFTKSLTSTGSALRFIMNGSIKCHHDLKTARKIGRPSLWTLGPLSFISPRPFKHSLRHSREGGNPSPELDLYRELALGG